MTPSTNADARRPRIPPAVWALGWVSLFMDFGSDIVHSLLPVLLTGTLGATAFTVGIISGVGEATVLVTKVLGGGLSDAIGRRKPLVVLGYGLAAAAKPVFPWAPSIAWVLGAQMVDRLGKGLRGAPRDALLGDIVPPALRGASFGLRQAMDTVGAVLGPLAAVGLMILFAGDIRHVLVFAVIPAAVSVLVLLRFVREPERDPGARRFRLPISKAGLASLGRGYCFVVVVGVLLSLARFSEAFLILRGSQLGLAATYAPLVLAAMSLVYAASAYPAGVLSDRLGRRALLVAGLVVLVATDVVLAVARSPSVVVLGAGLWGLHMGLTQGVLAAYVADRAPADARGTAFGMFGLATGLALLAASATAGLLWDAFGPGATFAAGGAFAALCLVATAMLPSANDDARSGERAS